METEAIGVFLTLRPGDMMAKERNMAKQNATHSTAPDTASARNTAQYADQSVMTGAGLWVAFCFAIFLSSAIISPGLSVRKTPMASVSTERFPPLLHRGIKRTRETLARP